MRHRKSEQGGMIRRRAAAPALTIALSAILLLAAVPAANAMTEVPVPDITGGFWCVTAVDTGHVWAGGPGAGIYFYDGSSWKRQDGFEPRAISAADPSHVWAVGEGGRVRFYDGSKWSWQNIPGWTSGDLNGVCAVDPAHVWAVGGSGADGGRTVAFFDGTGWSIQSHSATGPGLNAVSACDAGRVWAVGFRGTVLKTSNGGASWSVGSAGVTDDLNAVSALDPKHVWAVGGTGLGGNGTIVFFDGRAWKTQANIRNQGNRLTLFGVAAVDATHVYAAGDLGTVAVYDGRSWSVQPVGNGDHLAAACAAQGKYVWISGGSGVPCLFFDNPGEYRYYFAEGTTREGFDEWLCLQNPTARAITVRATYMLFGSGPVEKSYTVPPTSRVSVNVEGEVGPGQDVSVALSSEGRFYAERPMYFSYRQDVPGYGWAGGSCATGARRPGTDWYFAEGTTRTGFEEWICVQNPNGFDTEVTVDYIFAGAYTQQKKYVVGGNSRLSVFVNGDVGPGQDLSAHVHSDNPIVAERPMYFSYESEFGNLDGGHVVFGVPAPGRNWYFAEGTTISGFDEYLAVQNMNGEEANLTVRFLKTDGTETVGNEVVAANSRFTLKVNDRLGPGVDSSVVVESTLPVVVERPMYFSYGDGITGGHDVTGAPAPRTTWNFAEGCTLDGFVEYLCIGNPGDGEAWANIEFMREDGKVVSEDVMVGAKTRVTLDVRAIVGHGHSVSATLSSDAPVVVERPMYFNYQGKWTGGHDVLGM